MADVLTLKAIRVNLGLTQEDAATKLGISPETLGSWERGKTFPDIRQLKKIEETYGVEYSDINFFWAENTV